MDEHKVMSVEEVKAIMHEDMMKNPLPIADAPEPDPKLESGLLEEPKAENWMQVEGPYEWCRGFFVDGQYPEVGDVLVLECCEMGAHGDGSPHGAVKLGFKLRKLRLGKDIPVSGTYTGRISSSNPPASEIIAALEEGVDIAGVIAGALTGK